MLAPESPERDWYRRQLATCSGLARSELKILSTDEVFRDTNEDVSGLKMDE